MGKRKKKSKKKSNKKNTKKFNHETATDKSLMKPLTELLSNNTSKDTEDKNINNDTKYPTYQVHARKDDDYAVLQEVGEFSKTPHTLVEEIELDGGIHYQTLSCLHLSKNIDKQTEIPLVKTRISFNDGTKLNTLAYVISVFHTFEHLKEDDKLLNYVTDRNKKDDIKLRGFFSIQFHINKMKFVLETFKKYPGNTQLLSLMAEHLMGKFVQNKINMSKN